MIKLNKKELARIDKALDKSVLSFTKEVGNILKEKKVIPKNTGALEKSQKIRRIDRKMSYISYDVPYSARVYYGNPEESPSGPVKFKYRRKPRSENDTNPVNPHARARWIEDVLYDQKNAERFAKYVRMYLNELEYSKKDESDLEIKTEAGIGIGDYINEYASNIRDYLTSDAEFFGEDGSNKTDYGDLYKSRDDDDDDGYW